MSQSRNLQFKIISQERNPHVYNDVYGNSKHTSMWGLFLSVVAMRFPVTRNYTYVL
jgi:hypothetical protein